MKKIIKLSVMLFPACSVYFSKNLRTPSITLYLYLNKMDNDSSLGNSIVKSIKFLSLHYLFSDIYRVFKLLCHVH